MKLEVYVTETGKCPFEDWFSKLDARAAAKVAAAMAKLEAGNTSNVKSVGAGVHEYRIHFGPGYRVYFGFDGNTLVILLGGGIKKRQQEDVIAARERWKQYKQRKKR